jgi:ribosomal protein S10
MYITLSIYSKNQNSLTNFLKFFYKLKINKAFKLKFYSIQSQKKSLFSFFSTLQSPHVNKKSQEQFEYHVYSKKLKIHVSQITKFLIIWKMIKTTLFSDVKIKIEFLVDTKRFKITPHNKIDYDKFQLKFIKKNKFFWSNSTAHTSLKLLDIHGEVLLKGLFKSLDSSVGRAKDWKSLCRQFEPVSRHIKPSLW